MGKITPMGTSFLLDQILFPAPPSSSQNTVFTLWFQLVLK